MIIRSKAKLFSREELYELIWSKPMTKLAAEFGISDVALSKKCKKLGIPHPGLGYWRRVERGFGVTKTALPQRKADQPESIEIYLFERPEIPPQVLDQEVTLTIKKLEEASDPIRVRDDFRGVHPMVRRSRTALIKAREDDYGRAFSSESCLDVNVSKRSVERTLLILDAILTALEQHGFTVEHTNTTGYVGGHYRRRGTYLKKGDVEMSLKAFERANQRTTPRGYEYEPSGEIEITLDRGPIFDRRWKDQKSGTLEDQLTYIVCEIIESAELVRIERADRKAEQLRQHELKRQVAIRRERAAEEDSRRQELGQQAVNWDLATKIRSYLDACSEQIKEPGINEWLAWAHEHADRIDPLRNGAQLSLMERWQIAEAALDPKDDASN